MHVSQQIISIHAPHTRCDNIVGGIESFLANFNPRTSYEVRRGYDHSGELRLHISIHAPHAGCDTRGPQAPLALLLPFQSTHPMRGATQNIMSAYAIVGEISIHAPHAGCDMRTISWQQFDVAISIHAPHAGCDTLCASIWHIWRPFQSTHPMRGATANLHKNSYELCANNTNLSLIFSESTPS